MKFDINLMQITGLIIFILWSMGKVSYGIWCWIVPYAFGTITQICIKLCEKFTRN